MKKNLLIAIAAVGMMYSCGGASEEEMTASAKSVCDCVSNKVANRGDISADLVASTDKVEFMNCIGDLDENIDFTSDKFKTALEANCSNLTEEYNSYMEKINNME